MAGAATATAVSERLLGGAGDLDRLALIDGQETLTFRELNDRVRWRIDEIALPSRSVVTLTGDRSIEFVVTYLALLETGHVPLLAGDHADRLTAAWFVGGVATASRDGVTIEATGNAAAELHPDLALLVSTSGSTGSPKLVRLSHHNLLSNAEAIAQYQQLTGHDRGVTSLPLHYCFGLSVLHSHLVAGAAVVLTDASVVDPCFRTAVIEQRVTNLAGVPHTYEMLERSDPSWLAESSLRLLTQAGGRMEPAAVTRWAEQAEAWGAEFMVMYGQSEATARIAYLPAEMAAAHPSAVGRPIPGGSIELRAVDGHPADVGEIVYRGPNVMMGYARTVDDLAVGHDLDELRTGDLARYIEAADVYEIVGRQARFVKPFGLRIDLDEVQARLEGTLGAQIAVAGDDERLVVFGSGVDVDAIERRIASETGLPVRCIQVFDRAVPRTTSGKVDLPAMLTAAQTEEATDVTDLASAAAGESVAAVFATVFPSRTIAPDDTFVSLGGDSLSYVECSIRLEQALGRLPSDWHTRSIDSLADAAAPRRRMARLDTTVLLRAIGICLVVATHMRVWHVPGGAHTLLAVAGYNLARFMTPIESPAGRLRAGVRTAGRAAIPTVVWVGTGMLILGSYSIGTLLLVNNYVGPPEHTGDHWHFWFIEAFVHLVLLATLLSAVPFVRRLDLRFSYLLPVAMLALTLVLRMNWADVGEWYNLRFRTHNIAFFFVLGWLIQRSRTWPQRALTSLLIATTVLGYFDLASREWRIIVFLVVLVWARELPVPRWSVRAIGTVAAASMWIYVSHFTIWPLYRTAFVREFSYVLTIASGVAVWFIAERLLSSLNTWRQARTRSLIRPRFTPYSTIRGTL